VTAVVTESLVEVENESEDNSVSSLATLPVVTAITTEVRGEKKTTKSTPPLKTTRIRTSYHHTGYRSMFPREN
jgi:hypothetical protein